MYETIQGTNYCIQGIIVGTNSVGARSYEYNWMANAGSNVAATLGNWDSDYTLLGHVNIPFFLRGGTCNINVRAGVYSIHTDYGKGSHNAGFRPVVSSVVP